MEALDDDITHFLDNVDALSPSTSPRQELEKSHYNQRPFVTLTYAQSMDGRIAGKGNQPLRLSGVESMRMTHQIRRRHDAIMVGIGTVLSDDPQLTARDIDISVQRQPTPVVVDQHLKTPISSRLLTNYQLGIGKQPWIYASAPIDTEKVLSLANSGAIISFLPPPPHSSRLDLAKVFSDLHKRGIRRLMIEGGSSIISSCLTQKMPDGKPLVDVVIVTVAPIMVGPHGTTIQTPPDVPIPMLQPITTKTLGNDAVFVCKPNC